MVSSQLTRRGVIRLAVSLGAAAVCAGSVWFATTGGPMTEEQKSLLNGFKHLRKLQDYDYDFKLAKSKGICSRDDGPDLGYIELQGKYDRALSLFLGQTLDMQSLDAELEAKGIPGYNVRPDDPAGTMWEWFRSRSHLSSPYLYLRSNLRIERLSEEDIEALRTESLDTDEGRQALAVLAARTYQELTSYEGEHGSWTLGDGIHTVLYCDLGSHNPTDPGNNPAPAESLVLWLTFKDETLRDMSRSVEERNDIYDRNLDWRFYIQNEVIPAYEKKFSDILGYPVKIFLHDNPMTKEEHDEFERELAGN